MRHVRRPVSEISREVRVQRRSDTWGRHLRVQAGQTAGIGERLDVFLAAALRTFSRTLLRRWIDAGHVTCGGRSVDAAQPVRAGEVFDLHLPHPPPPAGHQVTPEQLAILLDEAGVLVLNKPVGQLSHPAGKVLTGTLLGQLQQHLAATGRDPAQARLVNRIDRDTSGIVLATCEAAAHRTLCAHLRAHELAKEYLALCHGLPDPPEGRWLDPIVERCDRRSIALHCGPEGKPSDTAYRVVEAAPGGRFCLLRLRLHTGRQHQIRLHASAHGCPLVGDWVYGTPCTELPGQALHAVALDFPHPATGATIHIEAPLLGDLATLWDRLRAGGEPTPRDLDPGERRRLGLPAHLAERPLPGGQRRPSWMDEAEFRSLRTQIGE